MRGELNSFSSELKPVWYTGWPTSILLCAASVVLVLIINLDLTIYGTRNAEYKMERGTETLYSGSCAKSKRIPLLLHLRINVLSSQLLFQTNCTLQCRVVRTPSQIHVAYARR